MENNKKLIIRIAAVAFAVILLLANIGAFYATSLLGKITAQTDYSMTDDEIAELLKEDLVDPNTVSESDILTEDEQATLDQNVVSLTVDENGLYHEEGVTNVLLLGLDTRKQHSLKGRSDVIMVVSINENLKQLSMVSLLRDTYVNIPGRDPDKLNAAYVYGGPELAMETVEGAFGIRIDKYVVVNFFGFIDIINALGGVDLDYLSQKEMVTANEYVTQVCDANVWDWREHQIKEYGENVHLTGVQAMGYVRDRYNGNLEYQRTERQRTVLTKMIEKLKGADILSLINVLDTVSDNMSTDYTSAQLMDLAAKAPEYLKYDVVQSRAPIDGAFTSGMGHGAWIIEMDFDINRQHVIDFIYGTQNAINEG